MDLSLLNLPDEKIYQICESLDNRNLSKLIQSHGKFYQICSKILDKRREYIISDLDKFSDWFLSDKDIEKIIFYNYFEDYDITVVIKRKGYNGFLIEQFIPDLNNNNVSINNIKELESNVPWITYKIPYNVDMDEDQAINQLL